MVLRSAPEYAGTVDVIVGGSLVQKVAFQVTGTFVEKPVLVPPELVNERIEVRLENKGPEIYVDYHVYITQ